MKPRAATIVAASWVVMDKWTVTMAALVFDFPKMNERFVKRRRPDDVLFRQKAEEIIGGAIVIEITASAFDLGARDIGTEHTTRTSNDNVFARHDAALFNGDAFGEEGGKQLSCIHDDNVLG